MEEPAMDSLGGESEAKVEIKGLSSRVSRFEIGSVDKDSESYPTRRDFVIGSRYLLFLRKVYGREVTLPF